MPSAERSGRAFLLVIHLCVLMQERWVQNFTPAKPRALSLGPTAALTPAVLEALVTQEVVQRSASNLLCGPWCCCPVPKSVGLPLHDVPGPRIHSVVSGPLRTLERASRDIIQTPPRTYDV